MNLSKVRNSCHDDNEEVHNYTALIEQPPRPQVQLPDGVSQPQDLKAHTGDDWKSDGPTSCQVEKVSPGDEWQFNRAD